MMTDPKGHHIHHRVTGMARRVRDDRAARAAHAAALAAERAQLDREIAEKANGDGPHDQR